jgi:hypothetical protein
MEFSLLRPQYTRTRSDWFSLFSLWLSWSQTNNATNSIKNDAMVSECVSDKSLRISFPHSRLVFDHLLRSLSTEAPTSDYLFRLCLKDRRNLETPIVGETVFYFADPFDRSLACTDCLFESGDQTTTRTKRVITMWSYERRIRIAQRRT